MSLSPFSFLFSCVFFSVNKRRIWHCSLSLSLFFLVNCWSLFENSWWMTEEMMFVYTRIWMFILWMIIFYILFASSCSLGYILGQRVLCLLDKFCSCFAIFSGRQLIPFLHLFFFCIIWLVYWAFVLLVSDKKKRGYIYIYIFFFFHFWYLLFSIYLT